MELVIALAFVCLIVWFLGNSSKQNKQRLENEEIEQEKKVKAVKIDLEELPDKVVSQLLTNETVYYFSYITFKGGCLSNESIENHWICLTNKRVLYKSKIKENNNQKLIEKNGVIPFEKISSIEIAHNAENVGCGSTESYELIIGSSGSITAIPIPTEEKGFEIRKIYMEVLEILNNEKGNKNVE